MEPTYSASIRSTPVPARTLAWSSNSLRRSPILGGAMPPATYASGLTASRALTARSPAALVYSSQRSSSPIIASLGLLVQKLLEVTMILS